MTRNNGKSKFNQNLVDHDVSWWSNFFRSLTPFVPLELGLTWVSGEPNDEVAHLF